MSKKAPPPPPPSPRPVPGQPADPPTHRPTDPPTHRPINAPTHSANSIGPAAGLELAKAIGAARAASETSMHGLALQMNDITEDADVDAIDEELSQHQGFVLEL